MPILEAVKASDEPDSRSADRLLGGWGWVLLSLAWLLPAALAATQQVARSQLGEAPQIEWTRAFLGQLPLWAPLIVLTPVIFGFVRRNAFDRRRPIQSVLRHALAGLVLSVLFLILSAAAAVVVEARTPTPTAVLGAVGALLIRTFHLHLFLVAAVMGVGHALESSRRLRARELQASRLRSRLSEAQLSMLRMQLQPHFLFNTLHSISSLMDEDVDRARDMVASLSDLLRHSLDGVADAEVPLERELRTAERYLAIEAIRFQDRLSVEWDVEAEALTTLVPTMVLQPLIENAVRHGIAERPGAGRLGISASVTRDELTVVIEDDGAGLAAWPDSSDSMGVGLRNTRDRLRQLHGEAASLELSPLEPRGTRARLVLPRVVSKEES